MQARNLIGLALLSALALLMLATRMPRSSAGAGTRPARPALPPPGE